MDSRANAKEAARQAREEVCTVSTAGTYLLSLSLYLNPYTQSLADSDKLEVCGRGKFYQNRGVLMHTDSSLMAKSCLWQIDRPDPKTN